MTTQTFRSNLTLQYEILEYDGDVGSPNVFVPVDTETADRRATYLLRAFASQYDKYWFTRETFQALMRARGVDRLLIGPWYHGT